MSIYVMSNDDVVMMVMAIYDVMVLSDGSLRCDGMCWVMMVWWCLMAIYDVMVLSNGYDVMVMSNDGVMVMMWWWRCDGGDNE